MLGGQKFGTVAALGSVPPLMPPPQKPGGDGEEEDIYAAFEPEGGYQQPQWGGSSNPYNVPSSVPSNVPPSRAGGNPLMRPPSKWGAPPGSQMGRMQTGVDNRPITSNRAANFNATGTGGLADGTGAMFDPTGQGRNAQLGPAPPLAKRSENSPEEQCMEMERAVNKLLEESAMLAMQGDTSAALEKAKDAGKKERALCKQREQLNMGEQINVDLTYAVQFNLAVQYHRHTLLTDALTTYQVIVRNMQYPQSGRLRVNMGNIYVEQGNYMMAVKMYRMSLEEIPAAGKELRFRIMRNIGNAHIKSGQYMDAVDAYETIMEGNPDIVSGFNLLLCYYALGDVDKMKRTFSRLLTIKSVGTEEESEEEDGEQNEKEDVLVDDGLRKELRQRRKQYLHYVATAARLIAPTLDKDWRIGYDYVIEQLRHYELKDTSSRLASELEMCKALNYLKYKKYRESIDGLKAFEKKEKVLRARAATNLAYLYFLEGDLDSGEKYADMSVEFDQYNAKALVNKGNFLYMKGDFDQARNFYSEGLAVEADNVEAIYNLGLATKQLGLYDESLRHFKRLQPLVNSVEVLYQIADLLDTIGEEGSSEAFNRLIGRVPTDPNVLARLGSLHAKEGDEAQAYHYYMDAYRYYQVNMDVISWLGAYFVKNEVYDKAMMFFERAAQLQPQEVKWQLMVASCHRRRGEYPQAKRMYEDIHKRNPDNMECLRYLVHLCKDSGLIEEANEWFKKVKKLESRLADQKEEGFSGTNTVGAMNATGGSSSGPLGSTIGVAQDREGINRTPENKTVPEESNSRQRREAANKDDDDDEVLLPGT